jgi:hypothetical protein
MGVSDEAKNVIPLKYFIVFIPSYYFLDTNWRFDIQRVTEDL